MPNNPEGHNQWGRKTYPPDDELRALFMQFAKEKDGAGLTPDEQLARLEKHGVCIKTTKLFELRKRLNIPSVRKAKAKADKQATVQAVVDMKSDDTQGRWGVGQVRQRLANLGHLVPRDELRQILHDHFGHEFDARQPGFKPITIERVPLNCLGPWHQHHVDGHEKLSKFALRMGEVTLPIYGWRDQYTSVIVLLITVPNVRLAETCGHLYLDVVEKHGCIPITLVSDKGSETGIMKRFQELLRQDAAPEFDAAAWPATLAVPSVHNVPAESFWLWLRKGEGHNIRDVILQGGAQVFNPTDPLHVDVFNWLWPSLLQHRLDTFREYWNNHYLRPQKDKILPSGTSPRQIWEAPESVSPTARNCSIKVRPELIRQLRDSIGGMEGRRAAYAFVSEEFQARADNAYCDIGCPPIELTNAWDIFTHVVDLLRV